MSDTSISLKSILERLDKIKIKNPLNPTAPSHNNLLGIEEKHLKSIGVSSCPYCNAFLDAAADLTGVAAKPKEGSISICTKCSEIVVFGKDLKLRKPNFEDWSNITSNPEFEKRLIEAQEKIKAVKDKK